MKYFGITEIEGLTIGDTVKSELKSYNSIRYGYVDGMDIGGSWPFVVKCDKFNSGVYRRYELSHAKTLLIERCRMKNEI